MDIMTKRIRTLVRHAQKEVPSAMQVAHKREVKTVWAAMHMCASNVKNPEQRAIVIMAKHLAIRDAIERNRHDWERLATWNGHTWN